MNVNLLYEAVGAGIVANRQNIGNLLGGGGGPIRQIPGQNRPQNNTPILRNKSYFEKQGDKIRSNLADKTDLHAASYRQDAYDRAQQAKKLFKQHKQHLDQMNRISKIKNPYEYEVHKQNAEKAKQQAHGVLQSAKSKMKYAKDIESRSAKLRDDSPSASSTVGLGDTAIKAGLAAAGYHYAKKFFTGDH